MPSFKRINIFLSVLPVLIFSLGYVVQLSTSAQRASSHLTYFALSYALFWAVSFLDYRLLNLVAKPLYIFTVVSLALVFVLGESTLGALRWISFGSVNFQPSEFAKLALVIFIAVYFNSHPNLIFKPKQLLSLLLIVLPVIVLVLLQPDLGSALIITLILIGMLFVARLNLVYFIVSACAFGFMSTPIWYLLKEYQKHRILVFLNPSLDTSGKGYNVIQSLISIGSGGTFGKGFGRGTQSHLNFLPIYWTDFVFAAFAEEWGFFGISILLIFLSILLFSILNIAANSDDRLGNILASGVFFVFFSQVVINVGMNLGLLPVTGVPLPLVSYGGTSMLTSNLLLGLVHSVWIYRNKV